MYVSCCNTSGALPRCYPEVAYTVDNLPASYPELGSGFLWNLIPCSSGIARCAFVFAFTFCMTSYFILYVSTQLLQLFFSEFINIKKVLLCLFQRIYALCYPELACIYSSPGSFSCTIASKPSTISLLLTISELNSLVRSGLYSTAVSTIPLPIIVVIL